MFHDLYHSPDRRSIFMFNHTIHFSQAQCIQGSFLNFRAFNSASYLFYFNCCHSNFLLLYPLNTFSTGTFLFCATMAGLLSSLNAAIVALTKLWGLDDPLDLANTSVMPTLSKTARIAPPAFTPVPRVAGLINTSAPPNFAACS